MSLNNPGEQVAQSLCVSNSAALRVVGGRIIGRVSRLRRLVLADRFFFVTCKLLPKRRILSGSEFACLARARDRVQPNHSEPQACRRKRCFISDGAYAKMLVIGATHCAGVDAYRFVSEIGRAHV